ncbi:MAG: hypothetical protein ABSF26_10720 [Thermoguttaceae bacterium]|jgi:hypothetical protein
MNEAETYHHTQKGPWGLLLYVLAAVFLTVSWYLPVLALRITFLAAGLPMFLLAASFQHLTVADEGNQLAIRFGPFPLLRKRIWYDDIRDVEKGRTTFLDGWGIHWNPWGGWVWNIWGRDCVVIRLKRGTIKVGTNDPDGLVAFLRKRIST